MLEEGIGHLGSRLNRRHRFGPMNCRVNRGRYWSFCPRFTSVKRQAPNSTSYSILGVLHRFVV